MFWVTESAIPATLPFNPPFSISGYASLNSCEWTKDTTTQASLLWPCTLYSVLRTRIQNDQGKGWVVSGQPSSKGQGANALSAAKRMFPRNAPAYRRPERREWSVCHPED